MSYRILLRYALLLALPLSGCEGCIDLDGYRIVASDGATSSGGAGGTSPAGCSPTNEGRIFVVAPGTESSSPQSGPCPAVSGNGVDVIALAPRDGACTARARIILSGSASFEQRMRVRHSERDTVALAGTFTGGELEFPPACGTRSRVALSAPASGTTALFVARLRLESASFCSDWVQRAWSEEPGRANALRVHSFEHTDDGGIIVGGALGGALTHFEGGDATSAFGGGAFMAHWSSTGSLRGVTALLPGVEATDAVLALAANGSSFHAAGFAQLEDPACHVCSGVSHVTNAAGACASVADAGNSGDASIAMDSSIDAPVAVDASLDAADDDVPDVLEPDATDAADADAGEASVPADGAAEPTPDALNAFVFTPLAGGGCGRFESFGSDASGMSDLQAILGISRHTSACGAYVSGITGRGSFLLDGDDARTVLAPGRDQHSDGFIARFDGGRVFGCPEGRPDFSVRLSAAAEVLGGPVVASRCREGVTATALVSIAGSTLALERCTTAAGCDPASTVASLGATGSRELVVMSLTGEGELDWHGSFAAVPASISVPAIPSREPLLFDLAGDARDDLYVLVRVELPSLHNVEAASCDELSTLMPGTWIVKLDGDGIGDRARCRWARRLD